MTRRETAALTPAFVGLAAGLLVLWLAHHVAHLEGGAALAALLFLPLLVYALVSGRIRELTAPGGVGVKLAEAAEDPAPVVSADNVAVPIEDAFLTRARGAPIEWIREIDPTCSAVLKIDLGLGSDYCQRVEMLEILRLAREQLVKFRFVVFLHGDKRVLGFMRVESFERLLADEDEGEQLAQAINKGHAEKVVEAPGMLRPNILDDATSREALIEMNRLRLDSIVVVDHEGRFKGVVEREHVLSRMMLALVK